MPETSTLTGPIAFDSSALLCRYLPDRRQPVVDQVFARAQYPVVTSLSRSEVAMGLHLAVDHSRIGPGLDQRLWSAVAADWSRFWVIPVQADGPDGLRAAELGAKFGLNLTNALHLVALDRLPRPASLLTFDDRQVVAAIELGIDIIDMGGTPTIGASAHGLLAGP